MKRIICIITAVIFVFFTVAVVFAKSDGCYRAEKDAAEWGNGAKFIYFGSACLLGPVGLLINILVLPSPDQGKLIGKSSAYVADYASCYKQKTFETASMATTYGCMGFLLIAGAAWLLFLSSIFSFSI